MAETPIEWTRGPNGEQGYTFNPWWGCFEVSPACDFCYARTLAKRVGHPDLWSKDGKRRFFGNDHWAGPLKWDARARHRGERYRVFCASMADVFDNHPEVEVHRRRLWNTVACTPSLDWLLLTKRIGNAKRMLPRDWGDGYPNVWLGATVVTQAEVDRDVPKLLRTPARVHFLSCEPLLGPIDLTHISRESPDGDWTYIDNALDGFNATRGGGHYGPKVDWVIAGGESGGKARPTHPDWIRALRDQCVAAGVPFHFKQWGEWAPGECAPHLPKRTERVAAWWNGSWDFSSLTPLESSELHIDDEPHVYRLGKKPAGRMLDGRTWDQSPKASV